MSEYQDKLGKPNVSIAGLQIWVHGREFIQDDWLIVTMHCGGNGSEVWVKNEPAIDVGYDIQFIIDDLKTLVNKSKTKAIYQFTEPYLTLEFEIDSPQPKTGGEVEVIVAITPDQLFQEHKYLFGVTLEEVKSFLRELESLLVDYPIKKNH